MPKTLSFTTWLSDYCKANKIRPLIIEGACRALYFSATRERYDTLPAWLDNAFLGPLSAPASAALEALWEALKSPKPKPKKAPIPPPLGGALLHEEDSGLTPSIDTDTKQL